MGRSLIRASPQCLNIGPLCLLRRIGSDNPEHTFFLPVTVKNQDSVMLPCVLLSYIRTRCLWARWWEVGYDNLWHFTVQGLEEFDHFVGFCICHFRVKLNVSHDFHCVFQISYRTIVKIRVSALNLVWLMLYVRCCKAEFKRKNTQSIFTSFKMKI